MAYPNQLANGKGNIPDATQLMANFNAALQKAGDTMTGALAMGSNKITGLGSGTATGDAVKFGQYQQTAPNILDNGGLEIWQRGTSFSTPAINAYTADRWKANYNGTPAFVVARDAVNIDSLGLYALSLAVSAIGASTALNMTQTIENPEFYRGRTLTFSCRVKASVASAVNIRMNDGTTLTASGFHSGGGAYETLTVTATIAVAAAQLNVYVGFTTVAPQVTTIYFDSAMLALGSETITFNPTNTEIDFGRCQRFYQRFGGNSAGEQIAPGFCGSATDAYGCLLFPTRFRVAPTLTATGVTGLRAYNTSAGAVLGTAISFAGISPNSALVDLTVASGLVAGSGTIISSGATTSYIEATADL